MEVKDDFKVVFETITNMFGNVLSSEAIYSIVESCDGNIDLAVDAVMNITNDTSITNAEANILVENNNVNPVIQHTPSVTSTQEELPPIVSPELPQSTTSYATTAQTFEITKSPSPNSLSYAATSQTTEVIKPSFLNAVSCNASLPSTSTHQLNHHTGAVPKDNMNTKKTNVYRNPENPWTGQMKHILMTHNEGSRTLICMRGAPGSGKSYLAKQIVEMTIGSRSNDFSTHIFSSDDFFVRNGYYKYDKWRLADAHSWNQNRVRKATMQGVSPIIIDNTNILPWEMEPYVRAGVSCGYIVEVVEPNTPWAKKANQLVKRNIHDVPYSSIRRMLDNYCYVKSGEDLCRILGISYSPGMKPPVMRTIPPVLGTNFVPQDEFINRANFRINRPDDHLPMTGVRLVELTYDVIEEGRDNAPKTSPNTIINGQPELAATSEESHLSIENEGKLAEEILELAIASNDFQGVSHDDNIINESRKLEVQKELEEIQQVEKAWEEGESWEVEGVIAKKDPVVSKNVITVAPKPPRKDEAIESSAESLMDKVNNCANWNNISLFMPPWNDNIPNIVKEMPVILVEKCSVGTSIELGDTPINSVNQKYKIMTATPRDINFYYMPLNSGTIPEKRMFDKSSMTNEQQISEAYRCKNEEKHFKNFKKLFKNISRPALRDIFDNCRGDVNWAVSIVLDGMANKNIKCFESENNSDSDDVEEEIEQCECLVNYNLIPDVGNRKPATTNQDVEKESSAASGTIPTAEYIPQKRSIKKEVSEPSMKLKREIEKNVVISDSHYSDHCLKIKNIRRGIDPNQPSTSSDGLINEEPLVDDETGQMVDISTEVDPSDEESEVGEVDKFFNVNIGLDLVRTLDQMFGRSDMVYPNSVQPRVSIPLSMLNELNALWMESLMHQLDEDTQRSTELIQQDEEFARQIAIKEAEMHMAGKEAEIPSFKELMDMDYALAVYKKAAEEWRNSEPNDWAAKMSRDKLYNLFPDVSHDVLSELLMAHDNNFNNTVESLLISTGQGQIVSQNKGVQKFIMEKEMEKKKQLLEKEKENLAIEAPYLMHEETADMSTVNRYREEAEKHLQHRNRIQAKVQEYIKRGMIEVALYYRVLASYHKEQFERCNSIASATLLQVQATQDPTTIDLHYFRVVEAKNALDLFVDRHIHNMRQNHNGLGVRVIRVFVITGRGLHSPNGPVVKPAVHSRLKERKLQVRERGPGMLATCIKVTDLLTHEL